MDFSKLSPDEVETLYNSLTEYRGVEASEGGEDEAAEGDNFQRLAQAISMCQEKISAMDEEIDMILKLLQDELIDPIKAGVEENRRSSGIANLQTKYGDKFGPHKDFYSTISGGADIFSKLFDEVESARSQAPEWNEGAEGGLIDSLLKGLEDRRSALKGLDEKPAEEAPKSVEVTEVSAGPNEKDKLKEMVKRMKKEKLPGMGM